MALTSYLRAEIDRLERPECCGSLASHLPIKVINEQQLPRQLAG